MSSCLGLSSLVNSVQFNPNQLGVSESKFIWYLHIVWLPRHRIYHYIFKCCSIFFPQPQFYFQHTYPRVLILRFQCRCEYDLQVRSSYSGQGECLISIEEIKIYLLLFNNFAFWALLRKNTWVFTWWKNALSSCDLSDCLIDSWSPMPSLRIFALIG